MEDQQQETTEHGPLDDVPRGKKSREAKAPSNGAAGKAQAAPLPSIRYAGERPKLKDLRAGLTPDARKIISAATQHFEAELIEVFDEIVAGVRTSSAEASFSTTLQIKSAKKHRLKASMSARVRSPRESLEFDMHLAADGQLSLGLPEGFEEDTEDDDE